MRGMMRLDARAAAAGAPDRTKPTGRCPADPVGSHLAPPVTTYRRRLGAGNDEYPRDTVANPLIDLIRSSTWLVRVLEAVRDESPADAWPGAGVLRDLGWGERYGPGFSPARVRDVDVAFFDPDDLSRGNDDRVTEQLRTRLPAVPWEAKNQAAVHSWYSGKFGGGAVEPLTSIQDAVGTWPETATAWQCASRQTVPSRSAPRWASTTSSTVSGAATPDVSASPGPLPGLSVTNLERGGPASL